MTGWEWKIRAIEMCNTTYHTHIQTNCVAIDVRILGSKKRKQFLFRFKFRENFFIFIWNLYRCNSKQSPTTTDCCRLKVRGRMQKKSRRDSTKNVQCTVKSFHFHSPKVAVLSIAVLTHFSSLSCPSSTSSSSCSYVFITYYVRELPSLSFSTLISFN